MQYSSWPDALPREGNQRLEKLESLSPWFEVYQVAEGTFALLEPSHYEEVISYLILGTERAVLFDTGMGIGNIQAEAERLTGLPVIVVNSHCHYDHVGDNYRYSEVWAFDNDSEVARIQRGKTPEECDHYLEPDLYLELPAGFDSSAYEIRPSPVTRCLKHLETIDLGGRTLTVYHTPGHSPGSICLLDDQDDILFTGDAYYPGMMYAHFEDSDFDVYRQSVDSLVKLLPRVRHLSPAHNEAYVPKGALVRMQEAFARIAAGEAAFEREGDARIYRFEDFGVMVSA
ncbi:MAG: MBL fold metallo-hydrolase [Anaerolineae bacterium]|jgi:glyoxylase-like metal-dependent hydrolase (beta-lactamase superfamily II)